MSEEQGPIPYVVKKLCEAIQKLPLKISDESVIREQAELLALAAHISAANNQPTSLRKGTKTAIRELKTLADDFLFLAQNLGTLHIEAQESMKAVLGKPERLGQLQRDMLGLYRRTSYEIANLEAGEQTKSPPGRPEAAIADDVTKCAAAIYESMTGLKVARRIRPSEFAKTPAEAGPYGPFHDFLTNAFAALGIKARADSRIKEFLMAKSTPAK